jgi:hypothetical protein
MLYRLIGVRAGSSANPVLGNRLKSPTGIESPEKRHLHGIIRLRSSARNPSIPVIALQNAGHARPAIRADRVPQLIRPRVVSAPRWGTGASRQPACCRSTELRDAITQLRGYPNRGFRPILGLAHALGSGIGGGGAS